MDTLEQKRAEFARNVWNHADDPFQMQFDDRPALAPEDVLAVAAIARCALSDEANCSNFMRQKFRTDPALLALVLQLVGLTRNKIIQDLKAAARKGVINVQVPTSYKRLPHTDAWSFAGPYLAHRVRKVFFSLKQQTNDVLADAVEVISQATWPGYIRQERAKRQGHEAEFRLAALHLACELEFEPTEKAENPLCRDVQIGNVSFDLVAPNARRPRVLVKSTVHTSNIGQYGESKNHLEVDEARQSIDRNYDGPEKPILLAFIDGVGFESNRAGLNGVLMKSDEFCQFKTIWKAIYISAQIERRGFRFILPAKSIELQSRFLSRWNGPSGTYAREDHEVTGEEIEAGEALIAT